MSYLPEQSTYAFLYEVRQKGPHKLKCVYNIVPVIQGSQTDLNKKLLNLKKKLP